MITIVSLAPSILSILVCASVSSQAVIDRKMAPKKMPMKKVMKVMKVSL
jgi:hypothetical protein